MIRAATLLALAGLALATGLIAYHGIGPVLGALAGAGIGLVWASLFHAVPMVLNARSWQVLWPGARRPSLAFFTWIVWVRESVNGLLPVARIGGEVVSARLMMRQGLRTSPVIGSLVVDMTLTIATQFLFTVAGLLLLVLRTEGAAPVWRIGLALLVSLPLIGLLLLVQRIGLFELCARLFRMLFGNRWAALADSSLRLDRAVRLFYRRRGRILRCMAWQCAGWVAGAGEVWLALHYLGHPVSLIDALVLEALIQAVSSAAFLVPGALGVQEGGFLALGSLLGLGPEVALALALARRVRDVIVFLPALVAWQVLEGRSLLARRRRRDGGPAERGAHEAGASPRS